MFCFFFNFSDNSQKDFKTVVSGIFSSKKWVDFVETAVTALWNWVIGSKDWIVKRREPRVLAGEDLEKVYFDNCF